MPVFPPPHSAPNAAWLTDTLHGAGALPRGAVTDVALHGNEAFNSSIVHLRLRFSADASPDAPARLLLKRNGDHDGAGEATFYGLTRMLPDHPPMLVRAYAAVYDPTSGDSLCLLEDHSETHGPPVSRQQLLAGEGVPSEATMAAIVEALARFHAFWWNHSLLGMAIGEVRPWYRDRAHWERHMARRNREWATFIGAEGATFPSDLRALYERVLAALPALWDRHLGTRVEPLRHLTLTHGDCYLTQFLCPKDGASQPIFLVDFQDVSGNFGAYDLAYLLPTFWTAAQRRAGGREARLLRRYHDTLRAGGVEGYGWDDLLADYRLMVTLMLFDPIWNAADGSPRRYWWPKLQCLTAAFHDLDCAAQLGL